MRIYREPVGKSGENATKKKETEMSGRGVHVLDSQRYKETWGVLVKRKEGGHKKPYATRITSLLDDVQTSLLPGSQG